MEHFDWIKGFVFPYLNFFIFAVLAFKFFKKPILQLAAGRKTDFERMLSEANKAKAEAERQNRELQTRLNSIDAEMAELKTKAKAEAELEAKNLIADAKRLAEHLKEEAKRIAETELKNARESLQQEIIAAVKNNVMKKVETDLDNDAQLSLVRKRMRMIERVRDEVAP